VGPRAGLDTEGTGKTFRLRQGSNLDRQVVLPVARHYTDCATPAHQKDPTSRNSLYKTSEVNLPPLEFMQSSGFIECLFTAKIFLLTGLSEERN
jgi:hypothetical protein